MESFEETVDLKIAREIVADDMEAPGDHDDIHVHFVHVKTVRKLCTFFLL